MNRLLLHVCCAVCAVALVDLLKDKFEISLFYYNPNIHPKEEYLKRGKAVIDLAKIYNLEFIEGEYDKDNWFERVEGLEKEPEGGKRCLVCFRMRLEKTYLLAKSQFFATTLSLSLYKDSEAINKIGKELGPNFLSLEDLDKKEIWKRTRELSRKYGFYHQKYCGCIFC